MPTVLVDDETHQSLKDLKVQIFDTESASFDAVVSELIEEYDDES